MSDKEKSESIDAVDIALVVAVREVLSRFDGIVSRLTGNIERQKERLNLLLEDNKRLRTENSDLRARLMEMEEAARGPS